jgi:hypothetical protein
MNSYNLINGIENTVLERHIQEIVSVIQNEAKLNIDFAARDNIHPRSIFVEVGSKTNTLKSHIKAQFDPEIATLKTKIHGIDLDKLKSEIEVKIKSLIKEIRSLEIDIARIPQKHEIEKIKWSWIGIAACVLLDCIVNVRSYQIWVSNLVLSFIAALLTAAGLGYAAHSMGKKINAAKTREQKLMWLGIGVAGVTVIFYLLGVMRQNYYGSESVEAVSPFLWAAWNVFFFVIAVLIAINNNLTTKQKIIHAQLQEKIKKKNELENERRALNQSIIDTERTLKENKEHLVKIEKYVEKLLHSIDMERNQICASCLTDYELKGGSIPYSQIVIDLQKQQAS